MWFIPWNNVKSWHCNACGICCKGYDVVLKLPEWLNIVKRFGVEYTAPSMTKLLLKRRADGSCMFLYGTPNASFCSLQNAKPQACKIWPFKVLSEPKYGKPSDAVYHFGDRKLFIYVDSACSGIRYGVPNQEFAYSVIPEFIEIALGVRREQFKSTATPYGYSV